MAARRAQEPAPLQPTALPGKGTRICRPHLASATRQRGRATLLRSRSPGMSTKTSVSRCQRNKRRHLGKKNPFPNNAPSPATKNQPRRKQPTQGWTNVRSIRDEVRNALDQLWQQQVLRNGAVGHRMPCHGSLAIPQNLRRANAVADLLQMPHHVHTEGRSAQLGKSRGKRVCHLLRQAEAKLAALECKGLPYPAIPSQPSL